MKRIASVTGTRADFGLLRWTLEAIDEDPGMELSLMATGMHLSPEFGTTVDEVEEAGFQVAERLEILLSSDSPVAVAKSVGLGVIGFADAFNRLRPDLVLLLGDRFETLAAAQAALIVGVPIAHVHGGETSEGSLDEAMRHSITKMAHLHFVTTANHRRRAVQLGEAPERVFDVGAPGTDAVGRIPKWSRADLEASLGCRLGAPMILVTYHPVTASDREKGAHHALIEALEAYPDAGVVVTGANADAGGRAVNAAFRDFVARAPERRTFVMNLGQERYLNLLREADAVVGNSSSALIEAPVVETPTVNVGDRQKGRDRGPSVLDATPDAASVREAVARVLDPGFRASVDWSATPYGRGGVAERIHAILAATDPSALGPKRFHDLDFAID